MKSAGSEFWPVLGLVCNVPESTPFAIGIYQGKKKPKDVNLFLEDFIAEAKGLECSGIVIDGTTFQVQIVSFFCTSESFHNMHQIAYGLFWLFEMLNQRSLPSTRQT